MEKSTNGSTFPEGRRFSQKVRRWRWWLLAFAWMGGIYFLSAQSNLALPVEGWWSGLLSWIAHFTEYAVLASLLWLALRSSPGLITTRHCDCLWVGRAVRIVRRGASVIRPWTYTRRARLAGGSGRCSLGSLVAFSFPHLDGFARNLSLAYSRRCCYNSLTLNPQWKACNDPETRHQHDSSAARD